MGSKFSAGAQATGYLYQVRYGLFLILEGPDEGQLSIESLDDIVFSEEGCPIELLQLKHRRKEACLTDHSADLWKTIRIWSTYIADGTLDMRDTVLALITTARAPAESVAALLRLGSAQRDSKVACEKLVHIANTSQNRGLESAFTAFKSLTWEQQQMLTDAIHVVDAAPDIHNISTKIKNRIKYAVARKHCDGLYERLEGWWFGKIVEHLRAGAGQMISAKEVHSKVVDIASQFGPDALPIDYADAQPPKPPDPEGDKRYFVLQLKAVALNKKRIEKALVDYYRAFEQRSKWVREELLVSEDLQKYEKKLVDEWERHFLAMQNEGGADEGDEGGLVAIGQKIYNWMELEADIRIRPRVTEYYVVRGSYHMLADEEQARVWWHPKFLERLPELLKVG